MERLDKLLEILACPHCHASLKITRKQLLCSNKNCKRKFRVQQGIPILLPSKLERLQDSAFKKAQIDFFDKWSSKSRGKDKLKTTSSCDFFSCIVGKKKINYSEKAMRQLLKTIPKNSWVLELGCGAGEHTAFLAKLRPDIHLVALDLSLKSVIETQKRLRNEKIKNPVGLVVADAETLPFKDKTFAGIIVVMFFHHIVHIRKSIEEVKRTLCPKGIGLIIDLVADNPFIALSRKAFPYFPYRLKKRFKTDYQLEDGEMPTVSPHNIRKIKQAVIKGKLKIIKEEYHDLFLFALGQLVNAFPLLQYFFPELILNFLYNIEKRLLKGSFFKRFTGAIILWTSS